MEDLINQLNNSRNNDLTVIKRRLPELKPYTGGSHDVGSRSHRTDLYKVTFNEEPRVELRWSFCPDCKIVRQQYWIGFNDETDEALVVDVIKNGERA